MTAKKLVLVYNELQSIMPPQSPIPPNQPIPPSSTPIIGQPRPSHRREIKNIIFTGLLFIFAPLLALVMIVFVFQSYVVDGSSMEPTLQNGNRLFILKLPKTIDSLKNKVYIPSRHEVIVFKKPSDPSTQLIKRVIGLPGDHVVVNDSHITIYNKANPNGFDPDAGTAYGKTLAPTDGNVDITVGSDELFVCGDNRSPGGSLDSRTGLGLVPVDNIIGRLWVRYFPLSEFRAFGDTTTSISWQQFSTVHALNHK
jgi:signal peptidase I